MPNVSLQPTKKKKNALQTRLHIIFNPKKSCKIQNYAASRSTDIRDFFPFPPPSLLLCGILLTRAPPFQTMCVA